MTNEQPPEPPPSPDEHTDENGHTDWRAFRAAAVAWAAGEETETAPPPNEE